MKTCWTRGITHVVYEGTSYKIARGSIRLDGLHLIARAQTLRGEVYAIYRGPGCYRGLERISRGLAVRVG